MKINGKPDGGGGGGVITGLSISANGTYIAGGGVDGYSPVEVSVPEQKPEETFNVTPSTTEQTITPQEGYVFTSGVVGAVTSSIDANIQAGNIKSGVSILGVEGNYTAPAPVTETLSVSVNNTYYPGQGVDGFSQVIVDVPQSVAGFTEKEITEETYAIYNLNNSASFVHRNVFEGDDNLLTVNLPNASYVGSEAFRYCSNLTSVNLASCKLIWVSAFAECRNLSYFNAPELFETTSSVFISCFSLTNIYLPKLEWLGDGAFRMCLFLSSVSFPSLKVIGNYAFSNCEKLESVDFPNCESVGMSAFFSCSALSYVNMPECKSIDSYAFSGLKSLVEVNIPNCSYINNYGFANCGLESLYLPKCLSVNPYTFQNNSNLSVISLPRVMSIGYNGFYGDSKISVIDLPFLMGQGGTPFQMAVPTSINLPIFSNMYNNASYNYFNWSLSLASEVHMSIGNKLYVVPSYANTLGLSNILSYNNCTIYVDAAMYDKWVSANGWSSLSTIFSVEGDPTVPMLSFSDGLLYGKTEALFRYWYSSNINFGISIDSRSVRNVSLPECRFLSDGVFSGLSLITSITLPKCEYIDSYVFSGCYNLETLEIPNCRYIGSSRVFFDCYRLTSITLTGSEVCTLNASDVFWPTSIPCQVYVPASLYDAYLSAPNWSNISSRIHPIE